MSKKNFDDDGRTIVDMNAECIPGYLKPEQIQNRDEMRKLNLTKKERRAIFWGSFLALIPPLIISLICFGGAGLLLYLWLK